MTKFNNEKGAALVLTLMIITLFLLFIMTQFYQITNTGKQITTTDKKVDARMVAEMGVDYYRGLFDAYEGGEEGIADFIDENIPGPKNLDEAHSFDIEVTNKDVSTEQIVIEYISTGEANGEMKTIEDTITINIEGGG